MTPSLYLMPGSRPGARPALTVRVDGRTGHVELVGRLDRGSAHVLYDAVSLLLAQESPDWTVDASHLTVADHDGLRAIGGAYRRALRHGRRLYLQGSSPSLRRVLLRLRLGQHVLRDDQLRDDPVSA